MDLNKKILYGTILVTIILVFFGIFIFIADEKIIEQNSILQEEFQKVSLVMSAKQHITDVQQFYTDASLTKDPQVLVEAKDAKEAALNDLEKMRALETEDEEKKKNIDRIIKDIHVLDSESMKMYEAYTRRGNTEGDKAMESVDSISSKLKEEIEIIKQQILESYNEKNIENEDRIRRNPVIISIIFGVMILLFAGVYFYVKKEITQKITIMSQYSEKLAAGDLNLHVDSTLMESNDEIGNLANSYGNMVSNLSNMVSKIIENASTSSAAAEELSASSEEVNAATAQMANTIQEIAKGGQNLSKTATDAQRETEQLINLIKTVATSAQDSAKIANEANITAEKGAEAAKIANSKMETIKSTVGTSANLVDELGSKIEKINKVVEVINSISEQTNLLALNAAIEAARAGESGRGFAVVADEVRKLAEESQKATSQIETMIGEIISSTKEAVESMHKGTKEVEESTIIVDNALQSLQIIGKKIYEVTGRMEHISAATQEQLAASSTVQKLVRDVSAVAEESAASSEEVSASIEETSASMHQVANSAQELAKTAEQLRELSSRFKINLKSEDIIMLSQSDHIMWRQKIRTAVFEGNKLTKDDVHDSNTCRFGKWYHGEGQERYGELRVFKEIDGPHKRLHEIGLEIVDLLNRGDKPGAEKKFKEVEKISENLLALLKELERKS